MDEIQYTPITKEILNRLLVGKQYTVKTRGEIHVGVCYETDKGKFINFGNVSIYDDWAIKTDEIK